MLGVGARGGGGGRPGLWSHTFKHKKNVTAGFKTEVYTGERPYFMNLASLVSFEQRSKSMRQGVVTNRATTSLGKVEQSGKTGDVKQVIKQVHGIAPRCQKCHMNSR